MNSKEFSAIESSQSQNLYVSHSGNNKFINEVNITTNDSENSRFPIISLNKYQNSIKFLDNRSPSKMTEIKIVVCFINFIGEKE